MCRSFVVGRITRNATNAAKCTPHSQRCASLERARRDQRVEQRRRAGSRRTTTSRTTGGRRARCAAPSVRKPVSADDEERAEDHRVLGLGLDADAVRALDVAAADRPDDADDEDRRRRRRRSTAYAWYDAAVQELQRRPAAGGRSRGSTVADEQARGSRSRCSECMTPGGRVAQQRLHPHAGAEVARCRRFDVAAWWCGGRRARPARSSGRAATISHAHDEQHHRRR